MPFKDTLDSTTDHIAIDNITKRFFEVFTNADGKTPNVTALKNMFIPEGIIISNISGEPQIYNLDNFINPRIDMLTNGTLTDFSESEISHKTEIYKFVAHRFCKYKKSGKLNGEYFLNKGMKTLQFTKIKGSWLISSVAWSDEK